MPKTDSRVAAGHTGQMSPECGFMIKALHPRSLLSLFSCPPAKGGSFLLKRARTEKTRARALCASKSNSEDHSSASRAFYSSSTASGLGLRSPASGPGPHREGLCCPHPQSPAGQSTNSGATLPGLKSQLGQVGAVTSRDKLARGAHLADGSPRKKS